MALISSGKKSSFHYSFTASSVSPMMPVTIAGNELYLTPQGILVWPLKKLVVVSDLHLEKGSYFGRFGHFLPPYDSEETLTRLTKSLLPYAGFRLILLGDTVHDPDAMDRLSVASSTLLTNLIKRHTPLWIMGNHEKEYQPKNMEVAIDFSLEGLTFRHQALAGAVGEISGHFHPKAQVILAGQHMRRACFVADQNRLVMPAFGSYTGGLDVKDSAFSCLFSGPVTLYLLGQKNLYRLENQYLK